MITESLLKMVFGLLRFAIGLLPPVMFKLPDYAVDFFSLVSTGLSFFPSDLFYVCIVNITFWLGVQFAWAVVEWVYKKFPGVD